MIVCASPDPPPGSEVDARMKQIEQRGCQVSGKMGRRLSVRAPGSGASAPPSVPPASTASPGPLGGGAFGEWQRRIDRAWGKSP